MSQTGLPGAVETAPPTQRWQPGKEAGPLNTDDGDSEKSSKDEDEEKNSKDGNSEKNSKDGDSEKNSEDGDSEENSEDEGSSEWESEDEETEDDEPVKLDDYKIEGYDTSGFVGEKHDLPPPPQPIQPKGLSPDMTFNEISVMDESACREVMLQLVAEHCCYGSRPAKNMTFTSMTAVTALHYTLETYGEHRSVSSQCKPYNGDMVDGPFNGPPPPPWSIPCNPDDLFVDQIKLIDVPHTSVVKDCHRCKSKGWLRCPKCLGRGRVKCWSCNGRGYHVRKTRHGQIRRSCPNCQRGKRRCPRCGGDGRVTCHVCAGFCEVRHYLELKVDYQNHLDDYILEKTDMPDELIRDVGGIPVFEQTLPMVWPISVYPVKEVNDNSSSLVAMHRDTYKEEKCIMQRQVLRAVPVTEVVWDWKSERGQKFWVYGNEKRVYCPDYPHQCCWGCVIL